MKTFFHNPTIELPANGSRSLTFYFSALKIKSVSGSVSFRLNSGEWITSRAGDAFETLPGELWSSVEFFSTAGGAVEVILGRGAFGGGGGGSGQTLQGTAADPNAAEITPPDPNGAATYFADTGAPALWSWSVTSQLWV